MSIPKFLVSSHAQYKLDTDAWTTWLSRTAKRCLAISPILTQDTLGPQTNGDQKHLQKSSKATKKSRKTTAVPIRYPVTTTQIEDMIMTCAARGLTLPLDIEFRLRRGISRRHFADKWYIENMPGSDDLEGHQYFTGLMRKSLALLSPKDEKKEVKDLSNRFEALDVEVGDETLTPAETEASSRSPKQSTKQPSEVYELTKDVEAELLAEAISLFHDLHEVEDEICTTWELFVDGQVSLSVATIATQAGLDICRRLVLEYLPPTEDGQPFLNSLLLLSSPILHDAKGRARNNGQILEVIAEQHGRGDFTYVGAGRTLYKFASAVVESQARRTDWPPTVPPYKFHSSTGLSDPSLYDAGEHDDFVLTQILLELKLLEDVKQDLGGKAADTKTGLSWVEDELMKSTRGLWEGDGIDPQAVFTCQVVMNILKICKGEGEPLFYRRLLDSAKEADDIFGFTVDEDNLVSTDGVKFFDIDQDDLNNIFHLVRRHITNPTLHVANDHFLRRRHKHEAGLDDEASTISSNSIVKDGNRESKPHHQSSIPPSTDGNFLLTHNPLYCGALGLDLAISMEKTGISLANIQGTIFTTAHLYNAFRQLHIIDVSWPDLERVMEIHLGPLFANELPTTPYDMHHRLHYRAFHGSTRKAKREQLWRMKPSGASTYLKMLIDHKASVDHIFLQLEKYLDGRTSGSNRRAHHQQQVNPKEFMRRLQEVLPDVIQDISIDYITLTKRCTALMHDVRLALHGNLGDVELLFTPVEQKETLNVEYAFIVHKILEDNWEGHTIHCKQKKRPAFRGSEKLLLAARTFETFHKTHVVGNAPLWQLPHTKNA